MAVRIETSLTRLLGLDVPIVQAPIGGLAVPPLAAAVANAGALGMLSMSWQDPDQIPAILAETRRLTDRAFGVNLILADNVQDERVRICLEQGVRLVSFFWGDPSPFLPDVHAAGALATLTVGSAEDARRAIAAGVDIVVAQGWEAGGHVWGEVASLPLIPAVVDAVAPTPVIAAGGIGDGRGLAAVLALGAAGGWMGTPFPHERGGACPSALPRAACRRQGDGHALLANLRRRLGRCPAPHAAQLHRAGLDRGRIPAKRAAPWRGTTGRDARWPASAPLRVHLGAPRRAGRYRGPVAVERAERWPGP